MYTMGKYVDQKTEVPGPLSVLVLVTIAVCFPLRTIELPNEVIPGFVNLAKLNDSRKL